MPERLLDDFIGNGEQARMDGEVEGLRGLEVDDELEPGRLQHRQVARLCAFDRRPGADLCYVLLRMLLAGFGQSAA